MLKSRSIMASPYLAAFSNGPTSLLHKRLMVTSRDLLTHQGYVASKPDVPRFLAVGKLLWNGWK
ncbi:hypothetical protein KIN20_023278 [Parelaphostrongylus tenuis]|uniref:Uncharacterized protein n=1 Tax=Parelaphostrongylus tenuis TaxID=148309 RepID=A0AAD5N6Z7_PARTN|nr:hypothetical protein KIN20_023278 [Parelaphostrongylus tenuis]